jgi:hypothetical protein
VVLDTLQSDIFTVSTQGIVGYVTIPFLTVMVPGSPATPTPRTRHLDRNWRIA